MKAGAHETVTQVVEQYIDAVRRNDTSALPLHPDAVCEFPTNTYQGAASFRKGLDDFARVMKRIDVVCLVVDGEHCVAILNIDTVFGNIPFAEHIRVADGQIVSIRGYCDPRPMLNGTKAPGVTAEDLQAFADAWNRHDVDALMSFMTDDCVFESSAGPDVCGTRYVGRDAVRAGYAEVWAVFPDANWGNARHFVQGNRGVSEWTFTGTRSDGSRVEVHGCDLFTFRDGKIALKNSYRKNRPPRQQ